MIVHLYEEHGADCVEHLHGMFAFALWDAPPRALLLARDRVGKKPLLYALRDGVLSWASEMGALLAGRRDPARGRPRRDRRLPRLGYVPAPSRRCAACASSRRRTRCCSGTGARRSSATGRSTTATKLDAPVEELCERIRAELLAATRRRLIADVPLGAFLSGGDRLLRRRRGDGAALAEPVRTFSIGFDHEGFDELPHARRDRRALRDRSTRSSRSAPTRLESCRRSSATTASRSPTPSAIPSFYLAELTRRHVTVALNGDGGDESFAGYSATSRTRSPGGSTASRRPAPRTRRASARGCPTAAASASLLNKARRLAGTLALDAAATLRALRLVVRRRPARGALHARTSPAWSAAPTPATSSRARWAGASGATRRRPDARGRRRRPTWSTT